MLCEAARCNRECRRCGRMRPMLIRSLEHGRRPWQAWLARQAVVGKKWMRRDWQLDCSAATGRSDALDGSFNMELCPLFGALRPRRHGRTLALPKCIIS